VSVVQAKHPAVCTIVAGLAFGALASACCEPTPSGSAAPRIAFREIEPVGTIGTIRQDCEVSVGVPYWDQGRAIRSLKKNAHQIQHISAFWYHLTPRGEVLKYKRARLRQSLRDFARDNDIKFFALVANLPDDEREGGGLTWDSERVGKLLRTRDRRAAHIADLMDVVRSMDFDGLHIDYEALPERYERRFTAFIRELGEELHGEGKLLAVALHSKTSARDPREDNGSWAQNWLALAPHVDQLHIMTYSQHTAATEPGPVAALDWFKLILAYAAQHKSIPTQKIFVGLPLYGEEWKFTGRRSIGVHDDLTFDGVKSRLSANRGREFFSESLGSPFAVYRDATNAERVIWFENAESSRLKQRAAESYGLCNMALWRLGGEDPDLWSLFRRNGSGKATRVSSVEDESNVRQ
jgi:spore germination protein YaaH